MKKAIVKIVLEAEDEAELLCASEAIGQALGQVVPAVLQSLASSEEVPFSWRANWPRNGAIVDLNSELRIPNSTLE